MGLTFPDGFVWGAATSAYQVEGATREDGRGESVWDTFCRETGRVRDGDTGETAADHYHRYPADLDLMRDLGLRSYRFSIAWPRVMPSGSGPVNQRGLDFYRRVVDGLLERGITPMATLFHWDLPQPLQDQGGWESRDVAFRFADYAAAVYAALGSDVPTWLTINEPKTVVQNGYLTGIHAPGLIDPDAAYAVAHHLLLAHGLAVQAHRASGATTRIGPALNLHPSYPADESDAARDAAWLHDGYENRLYLDPIFRGAYPRTCSRTSARTAGWRRSLWTVTWRSSRRRSTCWPCSTTARTTWTVPARPSTAGPRRRRSGSRSTPRGCTTS